MKMRAMALALLLLAVPALAAEKHKPPAKKSAPKVRKPPALKDPARPVREKEKTAMA